MKLATWNVRRPTEVRGERKARLSSVIREVDADVWVLTESVHSLSPGDAFAGVHAEGNDRPAAADETWVSIWSRFPIVERFDTSDSARAVAVLVDAPGRPLIVYGTVLPWTGSSWRQFEGARGCAFGEAVKAQLADWGTLSRKHASADLIVAGDLNQAFSEQHYYGSARNRAVLSRSLESVGLAILTAAPHDPVPLHAPRHAAIDHICAPAKSLEWSAARRASWPQRDEPDRRLSDHFGLSVQRRDG